MRKEKRCGERECEGKRDEEGKEMRREGNEEGNQLEGKEM